MTNGNALRGSTEQVAQAGSSTHTRGPWSVSVPDETLVQSADRDIAQVLGNYDAEYQVMAADARLIAAAPDLLEALKLARAHVPANAVHPVRIRKEPFADCLLSKIIDTAIAKAEGRS